MSVLVDTSIIIDYLRGVPAAAALLEAEHEVDPLQASEITRLEVLAGMRAAEERATSALLSIFAWHPVDARVAEEGGALGRQWLASHRTIDSADLAIAATSLIIGARLLTRNVRHFPMFDGLKAPY